MADDLEAFLRQAAQQRVQRQKQTTQRASSQGQPIQRRPIERRPEPDLIIEPEVVVERTLVDRLNTDDISDHADHLGSEHLGENVGFADERMEAHLHDQFDHQIGTLAQSDAPGSQGDTDEAIVRAADLIQMLKDPTSIRQAVLLSEILCPPTHRW